MASAELKTISDQKDKAEKALAHSEKERIRLTQTLTSSSATVQSMKIERDLLQSSAHGLNTEIEKLRSAKKTLESELAESQESEKKLKKALEETHKEVSKWQSTANARETSQKHLNQQLTDLRNSNGALQLQLNSATTERDNLKLRTTALKGEVETLERQVNGLKLDLQLQKDVVLRNMRECNEVKLLLEKAKEEGGLAEEREKQLKDFKRKLEDSKKRVEEMESSNAKAIGFTKNFRTLVEAKIALQAEKSDLNDNLLTKTGECEQQHSKLQALSLELNETQESLQAANSQKNKLEVSLRESDKNCQATKQSLLQTKTTKMDLGDRLESLELKLHLKEEEVTELRATIERNEVRIQDAKEELRDLEKYRKRVQELKNLLREANTKASEDETTISELKTKRNSQTTEESQQRQDIEGPLLVEINTLKERLSQRETDLQSSNGRISELERDIDASKACSAELQSELNHTSTELTSTLAELNNTQDGLKKAQEQNESSSSRCQELEQQCQELGQHIVELESAQSRLQKREEHLNQQVEVLKSERDTAQRQAQDFDRDGRDLKLKLQMIQSDYENEQENCDRERDTTQGLKSEVSQLIDRISTLEREVQALKDKGRHRREVMQQVVKLLQTQVAAVRSDLDQERSRQSDLKDSVEQLLTRSYIVRSLKTELVSRAAELQKCRVELQKCRDELKTTTAERDRLNQSETSAASQVSMQQQLHQFQEHVTQSLGQVHDRVAKVATDVSAVPELSRGVQQLHRQMSSSTSLDQFNVSGQQLTSRSLKLESAIDSEEHLDPNLMTSDASSDVPITGQQWTLSLARLQPTPEEDPGLDSVTSIASDLPDNGNDHHQLSPDSSPSSVDPRTTEVPTSPTEERDLVADLSRPTGPDHEMRTNSPDVSRMDRQPAISHYRQPSASDCHQPSASDHQQPSASDRHQPSVNDRDPQSFRDHPPRPWSEDNMDPLLINAPNPSLPTRIAGQRTHFSNVASYSAFPFQSNPMSFGGFHWVPVPTSFPTTSVMPIHDNPSPMSLPSSSGSPFPMHGGRDSSLSATVATSLQDSVDPALLKKRITKLSELMPYVPVLAHKVPQIAGYLDMYTKLQALKQTCSDPEIHLQELLSQWLEGQEDEERPHYWEYFITLVKAVDQYPVVRRIYIDLAAGQAKS